MGWDVVLQHTEYLGCSHFYKVWSSKLWDVVTWECNLGGVVGCLASWGVWCHCGREEEDSLLTDNESYANQLATTPCANMAIVDMKGLLHGWHQRAFIVEPRIKTIFILTRYQISTGLSTAIRGYLRFALIYSRVLSPQGRIKH